MGLLHQIAQRKRYGLVKTVICLIPWRVEDLCIHKHTGQLYTLGTEWTIAEYSGIEAAP
jgi:hypothetical protein